MERLTEHDCAVLNVMFDPFQMQGSIDLLGDLKPQEDDVDNEKRNELDTLDDNILNIIKHAILKTESHQFDEAFCLFEKALKEVPNSPTILNDRAQALRLAGRNAEALEDLNTAIKLSQGKGKAGIQALCQRGVLYRITGEYEKAKQDFTLAAKAGSRFARSQLVALNPYAAMCNIMLREITFKTNSH